MRIAIWAVVLLAANIMWAKSDQSGDSRQAANNNQGGSATIALVSASPTAIRPDKGEPRHYLSTRSRQDN
jgi:hypothetical protein